jgi:hypothetical protein
MMEKTIQCPFCGEDVRAIARVCRHCHSDLHTSTRDGNGTFLTVRLRVRDKTYIGDIFVPNYLSRVSDVLNDKRHFIILTDAAEETGVRDLPIGFLAINKTHVERIELKDGDDKVFSEITSRIIEWGYK